MVAAWEVSFQVVEAAEMWEALELLDFLEGGDDEIDVGDEEAGLLWRVDVEFRVED